MAPEALEKLFRSRKQTDMPHFRRKRSTSSAISATAMSAGAAFMFVVSLANGAEQKAKPAKDKVALTFAWPKNLKGSIEISRTKRLRTNRGKRNQKISGSYDFRVRPVAGGLSITQTNAKIVVDGDQKMSAVQAKLQDFLLKTASSPPSFVVAPNGQFQRLDGLQEFQKRVSDGLDAMISGYPSQLQQKVKRVVAPMISLARLQQQIVSGWNRDVGFWTGGAVIDHGDTYVFKHANRFPAFGTLRVPMATHFEFAERVPCTKKETSKRCVRLESRTKVDNKELTKAIEKWVASTGATGKAKPNFKNMRIDVSVTLITDPRTLIPYHVREKKVTVASIGGPKGGLAEQVQITELKYKY